MLSITASNAAAIAARATADLAFVARIAQDVAAEADSSKFRLFVAFDKPVQLSDQVLLAFNWRRHDVVIQNERLERLFSMLDDSTLSGHIRALRFAVAKGYAVEAEVVQLRDEETSVYSTVLKGWKISWDKPSNDVTTKDGALMPAFEAYQRARLEGQLKESLAQLSNDIREQACSGKYELSVSVSGWSRLLVEAVKNTLATAGFQTYLEEADDDMLVTWA